MGGWIHSPSDHSFSPTTLDQLRGKTRPPPTAGHDAWRGHSCWEGRCPVDTRLLPQALRSPAMCECPYKPHTLEASGIDARVWMNGTTRVRHMAPEGLPTGRELD